MSTNLKKKTRVATALSGDAAEGEPDLGQAEPQALPAVAVDGSPEDPLSPSRIKRIFDNYVPPTWEECVDHLTQRYLRDAPNCISNWLPLLDAGGMRTPETSIYMLSAETYMRMLNACEGEGEFPGLEGFEPLHEAYLRFGGTAFMKLGNFSAKHSWEQSCHLGPGLSTEDIRDRVARIMYDQCLVGCTESLAVAVRRMIPTKPAFLAEGFSNMPVTRERRLFTNGCCEVACNHPYWPPEVFREITDEQRAALDDINQITPEEEAYLVEQTQKAARLLAPLHADGWSIDFLQDVAGEWWLIDVARANQSYHWPHNGEELS